MQSRNILKVLSVVFLGVVVAGLLKFSYGTDASLKTNNQSSVQIGVSVTIENIYDSRSVLVPLGYTVLQAIEMLNAEDSNLKLEIKEYPGLGTLVQAMGGMTNGKDERYWQFEVNNVMPQIGADQYKLEKGDLIEWHFKKSEF